ncbi:hypothetical protein [Kitasatospora sp. NPDC001547]|uniref:hypothetical protein n=1 Tax=Kitasatospora sp. NPDC001547 TaxID=3364015 RepID=UPI00368D2F63|nr:hypothetical protein KitaXyl93_52340 [Kitasatospora sp. Xyl93]
MDGIPPERMVTDSWPALHGRPVLRRTVAVGLVLCVSVAAALVVRGVNTLTAGRVGRETDRDRAERLAGLHPSQHPGLGRFYVPVGAVYTHTSDGAPVAYLHYRLGGGRAPGLGDFLSAYDLPSPGPAARLPADLLAALGGDEPAEAPELPESPLPPAVGPSPAPSGTAAESPAPTADPADPGGPPGLATEPGEPPADSGGLTADSEASVADPTVADPTVADPEAPAAEPAPAVAPAPALEEPTPEDPAPAVTPTPTWTASPSPTGLPGHAPTARRIYVATIPGGLPGAADIYVRATG